MGHVSLRIPRELWHSARTKALREGLTISEVTRRLLERWVAGQIEIGNGEKQPTTLTLARQAFGMWADRDPDVYLAQSRSGLAARDREVEDARN
ncbi:MAG TPA: hypothetical protein ENK56_02200 [Chloroflexi bacterium]|nr:hypothetical protein [Chloroflexota bacterium]